MKKEDARRQILARMKEMNITISLGPRAGTQCWSGVF
jgi:hypothetical protein